MKKCFGKVGMLVCAVALAVGCGSTSGSSSSTSGSATATDGADGQSATDGNDGTDGSTSTDGADGSTSTDGTDGSTSTNGADGNDGTDGVDGVDGTGASVSSIQDSATSKGCDPSQQFTNGAEGVAMTLTLTTPVYDATDTVKAFYAADASGEYNGLLVTSGTGVTFPELAVGDTVDVVGDHVEFFCMTQLRATSLSRTGAGTPVEATTIQGDALASEVTAEPLEGVLVKLENVTVESTSQFDFTVTGGAVVSGGTFSVGFFPNVGDEIASVVGVVEFSFGQHRIQIRSPEDLDSTAAAPTTKTIAEIQEDDTSDMCTEEGASLPPTQGNITTSGIVVSPIEAVTNTLSGAYISTDAPGAWSGVFVIWPNSAGYTLTLGDKVTVSGDVKEFFCSTQIDASNIEVTEAGTAPEPATVASDAIDESYEGVFVKIANAEVTSIENLEQFGEVEVDGALLIALSDFGVSWSPAVGDTVSEIVGAVKYSFGDHKLVPFGDAYITE